MDICRKVRRKIQSLWKCVWNTAIPFWSGEVMYYNQCSLPFARVRYGQEWIRDVGCGPFSCAIAVSTLLHKKVCPQEIARWAVDHGYYEFCHGSLHSLIPDVMKQYGLCCEDLGSDTQAMMERLSYGGLAIVLCKAGSFSGGGHFITVGKDHTTGMLRVYNSSNVLDCYRKFTEKQIREALPNPVKWIGPIWYICDRKNESKGDHI